jgi:general secretion pathway protein E
MNKAASKPLDLQQIFTWLLADGVIEKADVKSAYNHAQAIYKNAAIATHPLTAVAYRSSGSIRSRSISPAWPT